MTRRQVGVTIALFVCSALLVAVPVMGLGGPVSAQVNNSTNATNGTFGQQVSSFMQASAVDANTSLESGMWQASVNQTLNDSGDAAPQISSRTAKLERKLQQLQNKSARLKAQRDQLPEVAYTARASALRAQIANLKDTINQTTQTASRVGVNTSRLDRLRTAAGNATGPEVAAIARNITDTPRGPPAGTPGGGPPADAGQGTTGPPANTQNSADRTNQSVGDGSGNGNSASAGRNQSTSNEATAGNQTNGSAAPNNARSGDQDGTSGSAPEPGSQEPPSDSGGSDRAAADDLPPADV